jgi:glutamate racemase
MKSPLPAACIGVFDSGVGGLTVLRELHSQAPTVPLHYVADTAHAPYGERSADEIVQRCLRLSEHLIAQGAAVLVIACNTATAHAVQALRDHWPDMPIVGTEPGIKPAVAATRNGRIGVLATPATIASARYQSLLSRHSGASQVISQPCPGLADLIEQGDFASPALQSVLDGFCAPLRAAGVDTVLMGCTHYPLIQPLIQAALGPDVQLLNIETAVARQALSRWAELGVPAVESPIILETTGNPAAFSAFARQALSWPQAQATLVSA